VNNKEQDFYQEFEQQPPVQRPKQAAGPKKSFLKKVKDGEPKSIAIFALITTTIILVSLSILLLILPKPVSPPQSPTPTPLAQPSPTSYLRQPSKYATDSAVLQIEDDLTRILNDLQKVDLKEGDLTPPQIDTKVTIQ
jgi:hypothetical protein